MTKNRSYSIAFKRQVAEEYLAGAAPSDLGKRHDLCRNLSGSGCASTRRGV
jgi:transposase-like protein